MTSWVALKIFSRRNGPCKCVSLISGIQYHYQGEKIAEGTATAARKETGSRGEQAQLSDL